MVKKILIWVAIIVAALVFIVFLVSTLVPQKMADFFMAMGASRYEVEIDGKDYDIEFADMGEGVTNDDRLYVMKKMIAIHIYVEDKDQYGYLRDEFNQALVEASEDKTLDAGELGHLRELHADVVDDEMVAKWIKLAKELEENQQMGEDGQ